MVRQVPISIPLLTIFLKYRTLVLHLLSSNTASKLSILSIVAFEKRGHARSMCDWWGLLFMTKNRKLLTVENPNWITRACLFAVEYIGI